MISPSCATSSAPSVCRCGLARTRSGRSAAVAPRWRARRRSRVLGAAHGGDQPVAVEGRGTVGGDDLAVAHHDDAVGIVEHLAEQMRDQDAC